MATRKRRLREFYSGTVSITDNCERIANNYLRAATETSDPSKKRALLLQAAARFRDAADNALPVQAYGPPLRGRRKELLAQAEACEAAASAKRPNPSWRSTIKRRAKRVGKAVVRVRRKVGRKAKAGAVAAWRENPSIPQIRVGMGGYGWTVFIGKGKFRRPLRPNYYSSLKDAKWAAAAIRATLRKFPQADPGTVADDLALPAGQRRWQR